jgi:hypothetical protein
MTAAWLSFAMALAGFGLISLAMQRHAGAWTRAAASIWISARGMAILRLAGTISLVGSGTVALHDNLQVGAIYWSAYAMVAVLLITGLQAFAERWVLRVMLLVIVGLIGSLLAY